MATTTVSDYVIWAKHIHDDPELATRVQSMWAGETIQLEVDGVRGTWRKMDDGADGRPTPGLRPLGSAQVVWRSLFKRRRGALVSLKVIEPHSGVSEDAKARRERLIFPPLAKTEEERAAALERFLHPPGGPWRSQGPYGPRDELYDRD
jgi:hypothetical protein